MKADATGTVAQVNLDYCSTRSPIDGRTGIRNVDVGNLVVPSSPPLVTVQRFDPLYADFTIAEPDSPRVRQHLNGPLLEVLTEAENDYLPPRRGELTFIDNAVQPGMGTVRARATTDNHDRGLWPSQFVRVRLILVTLKNVMMVLIGAVRIVQNGRYGFVLHSESKLDLLQVR